MLTSLQQALLLRSPFSLRFLKSQFHVLLPRYASAAQASTADSLLDAGRRPLEEPMPAWRRKVVTTSANCAGFLMLMLGFRMRVRGYENFIEAKKIGAVRIQRSVMLTSICL